MNLNYAINGVPFSQLGIKVASSEGLLDGLELKDPFSVNWPDANGQVVDLARPRYQAREIKLECWMVAPTPDAFLTQSNQLITQFLLTGTQRLSLTPVTGKPLVYEVYCKNGITIKKQWRDTYMVGEFTLTLIEPQPVKWVHTAAGGASVSMRLSAPSPLTFYWGDGTNTVVSGTNQTVSHTYGGSSSARYQLIVSGELQRMEFFESSNLTELWPRLY